MNDADMMARLKELYLPSSKDFVLVDVPDMRFVMIDGQGANGHHHEVYLNDPNRVAPEKLKTVLRQPVRQA